MKLFKNIFARIWAVWGIISFIATFLIIVWPSLATKLIKDPKGMDWFIKISKWWMTTWLYLVGCPMKVYGRAHFAEGKTYVVTCNHNALIDIPLSSPFIPGANQTIAKDSFTKVPIFGWYYARGSVLVNRSDTESRKKSYDLMKAALRKGFHMCIYPEGSRNKTGEALAPFHDGAFKLAVDTQTQIIPTIILGTRKAMPIHKFFYLWPTQVEIHFLPPVDPGNHSRNLKQEVFTIMEQYYISNTKAV